VRSDFFEAGLERLARALGSCAREGGEGEVEVEVEVTLRKVEGVGEEREVCASVAAVA